MKLQNTHFLAALLLVVLSSVFSNSLCYAQDNILSDAMICLENGDNEGALRSLNTIENRLLNVAPDSVICDFHYFKGILSEMQGDIEEAELNYYQHCNLAEKIRRRDESYVDASARLINYARNRGDWEAIAKLCREALRASKTTLELYPNTVFIYEAYVHAMNSLQKYTVVEDIAKKGLPYIETHFKPTNKEYYTLRVAEIVALLMMSRNELASVKYTELKAINDKVGANVMAEEIKRLEDIIQKNKTDLNWRERKNEIISGYLKTANSLLQSSPKNENNAEEWKRFFRNIQDRLELLYFDTTNNEDEKFWDTLLAMTIVYFNSACSEMPNRGSIAYDNVLLRKNFLDYHSPHLHKRPLKWQDIKKTLNPDEAAIEITMAPDEILLLRSDYDTPISIPIDSCLMNQFDQYNSNDAIIISEFYRQGSALTQLWDLVNPYLKDCKTVYLSPSNLFCQFNYASIPYRGGYLDDAYQLIQMTTTADIAHFKTQKHNFNYSKAAIFGGVNYDISESNNNKDHSAPIWTYKNDIPAEMRSGYGYLPWSLTEAKMVTSILHKNKVKTLLFTGANATEQSFKTLDKANVDILHIATHTFSLKHHQSNNIRTLTDSTKLGTILSNSGILLAGANTILQGKPSNGEDGILTSKEISEMSMSDVKLAVIPACSSGLGDLVNTRGLVYGIVNALKTSGVSQLVVTLWDVPDKATSVAMESFYQNLFNGLDSRQAVKAMRKEMIAHGFIDPFYWASIVVLD